MAIGWRLGWVLVRGILNFTSVGGIAIGWLGFGLGRVWRLGGGWVVSGWGFSLGYGSGLI